MTKSDKVAWALAVIICFVTPLALGHHGLALAGAGGLAVLAWLLGRDKLL